jgi:hypothetical protein
MAIIGSFSFASLLASDIIYPTMELPLTWSISDGIQTITEQSGTLTFTVGTDSFGKITNWGFATPFNIPTGNLLIMSEKGLGQPSGFPCGIDVCDAIWGVAAGHAVGVAGVINNPGTWTATMVTPEPSSLFLVTTGLFAMVYIGRKSAKLPQKTGRSRSSR